MEHDKLEIGVYYRHVNSGTLWHPIELNNDMPFTRVVVELKKLIWRKSYLQKFYITKRINCQERFFWRNHKEGMGRGLNYGRMG